MIQPLAIDRPTTENDVPKGSATGIFDWVGRLFVPQAVQDDWARNDQEIRDRAQNDSSSKDIQARIASSAAMAKSAENLRVYTSAPFVGDVLTGSELASIAGDAALNAPGVLINTVNDKVVDPVANVAARTIKTLVPWQVWAIVAAAVLLFVGIFAFAKSR